jgi:hypothetical protein
MLSSYQVVLWKQESFGVLRPLQIEFFRNLLGLNSTTADNQVFLQVSRAIKVGRSSRTHLELR